MKTASDSHPTRITPIATIAAIITILCLGCSSTEGRLRELAAAEPTPFSAYIVAKDKNNQNATTLVTALADKLAAGKVFTYIRQSESRLPRDQREEDIQLTVDFNFEEGGNENADPENAIQGLEYGGRTTEGCVLGFLAWSTLAPLSLLVPDVEYRVSGTVDVTVEWAGEELTAKPKKCSCSAAPCRTRLPDRQSFTKNPLSYLGCIILPPWVFDGADEKELRDDLLQEFINEAAMKLAEKLKRDLQPAALSENPNLPRRKKAFISIEDCMISGQYVEANLVVSLPQGGHLVKLEVTCNDNPQEILKPYGRDALLSLSKKSTGWGGGRIPIRFESVNPGGLNIVTVKALGYADLPVSFTFLLDPTTGKKVSGVDYKQLSDQSITSDEPPSQTRTVAHSTSR